MIHKNNNAGLTLVEVISATIIILVGLVAMLSSSVALLGAVRYSKNFLIATQLAREALEMTKKDRDEYILGGGTFTFANWLLSIKTTEPAYKILEVDNGGGAFNGKFKLTDLGAGKDLTACIQDESCNVHFFENANENIYGNGTVNGSIGAPSIFYRVITLADIKCENTVPGGEVGTDPTDLCNSGDVVGVEVTAQVEWFSKDDPKGATMATRLYRLQ